MQSKDLIRDNLVNSESRVLSLLKGLDDFTTTFPTPNGGCHALWIVGHLAYSEGQIIQTMMLGKENPLADWKELFGDGTEPTADAAQYPPFDEVLAQCRAIRESTRELLDTLSEDDLDQPSANIPEELRGIFGTRRLCLQFASDHWYMHRGQLADARRAAGLPRRGR